MNPTKPTNIQGWPILTSCLSTLGWDFDCCVPQVSRFSRPGFLRDALGLSAYILRSDICISFKSTAAVDSLSFLDERLHPPKNARPSLRVIRGGLRSFRKSFLANPHHRARPNPLRSTMQ